MFEKGVWISDDEFKLLTNYFLIHEDPGAYYFILDQAQKRTIEMRGYGTSVIGDLFGKFTISGEPAKKATRESQEEKENTLAGDYFCNYCEKRVSPGHGKSVHRFPLYDGVPLK